MKLPIVRRSSHERVTREREDRITALAELAEARRFEIECLQVELQKVRDSRRELLRERSTRVGVKGTSSLRERVPIVFGIDIEPDRRVVDLNHPTWAGALECFAVIEALRSRLAKELGVQLCVTWFPRADPQVEKSNGSATWALEQFPSQWADCRAAGDEIGLHMHPWKWENEEWVQDHGDDAWIVHCLRSSLAAFRQVFGVTPAAYRGGDRYLSNVVAGVLEEEGVRLDLTLERMPSVERLVDTEKGTGRIPDGSMVPSHAFRRSLEDFRLADPDRKDGLGMMPLTAYQGGTLIPWMSNVDFERELGAIFQVETDHLTHLAFVARSDVVLSAHREDFLDNVWSLALRVLEGKAVFATASEAWPRAIGRTEVDVPAA